LTGSAVLEKRSRVDQGNKPPKEAFASGRREPAESFSLEVIPSRLTYFNMAESVLKWVDEDACREAIKAVRRDGDAVEWYASPSYL
jgi:hypothetical protein